MQRKEIEITQNFYFVVYGEPEEHHHRYRLVLKSLHSPCITITKSIIMALTINIGELVTGVLGLVDHATGNPVSASFSGLSVSSDNTAVFTTTQNASNPDAIDVTGTGVGTANLSVTVIATYTDGNTGATITATKTLIVAVTVNVNAQATDLTITFGPPVTAAQKAA